MKCQSAVQYFIPVVSITTKRVEQCEKTLTNWEEISPFYRGDFHHWKENAFPITMLLLWLCFSNRAITAQQSLVLHVSSTRYVFAASLIVAHSKCTLCFSFKKRKQKKKRKKAHPKDGNISLFGRKTPKCYSKRQY